MKIQAYNGKEFLTPKLWMRHCPYITFVVPSTNGQYYVAAIQLSDDVWLTISR